MLVLSLLIQRTQNGNSNTSIEQSLLNSCIYILCSRSVHSKKQITLACEMVSEINFKIYKLIYILIRVFIYNRRVLD